MSIPFPGNRHFYDKRMLSVDTIIKSVNPLPGEPAFLRLKIRKRARTQRCVNPLPGEPAFLRHGKKTQEFFRDGCVNPLPGEPAFLQNNTVVMDKLTKCQSPSRGTGISTLIKNVIKRYHTKCQSPSRGTGISTVKTDKKSLTVDDVSIPFPGNRHFYPTLAECPARAVFRGRNLP